MPGMTSGESAGSRAGPSPPPEFFCASGAKRSAMVVGVGSACGGAAAASRSVRLPCLTIMSD